MLLSAPLAHGNTDLIVLFGHTFSLLTERSELPHPVKLTQTEQTAAHKKRNFIVDKLTTNKTVNDFMHRFGVFF